MSDICRWIPIAEAVSLLEPHYGSLQAKALVLDRVSASLLRIKIARLRTYSFKSFDEAFGAFAEKLKAQCQEAPIFHRHGYSWEFSGDEDSKTVDDSDYTFAAYGPFQDSNKEWITKIFPTNVSQYWANWELSEFKSAKLIWPSEYLSDYYLISTSHAIGIEVEGAFVERLIPIGIGPGLVKAAAVEPVWKFDWLGAFAHVAATCRFDDVIGDVRARGALAEIEKILKEWFAAQNITEPSEAAIRTKAHVILSALKSKASAT